MKKGILILPALFIIAVSLTIVVSSSINYFQTENYAYSINNPIQNKSQGEVGKNPDKIKQKTKSQSKIGMENENYKDIKIIISDKKLRSRNNLNTNESELTKNINNCNNIIYNNENNNCTNDENIDFSASKVIIKNVDDKNLCNSENEIDMYLKNDEVEDKPVFKVKTSKIMGNLTIPEQMKLFKISRKLNIEDYIKIEEYLKAKNQEQGILNAIYLLKEKLSDEDYEKIRDIADRFIDMDVVEDKR